jgi:hypothetical protein
MTHIILERLTKTMQISVMVFGKPDEVWTRYPLIVGTYNTFKPFQWVFQREAVI